MQEKYTNQEVRGQYCHRETIDFHEKNLKRLLDLNFGKDWRLFLILYYSKEWQKHTVHYKNPTYVERKRFPNPNHGAVARKIYYGKFKSLFHDYINSGLAVVEQKIKNNEYRFEWSFKKEEGKQIIVSDELFNLANEPAPTAEQQETERLENLEENLNDLNNLLNEVEEVFFKLRDKEIEEGLTEEESILYKDLKARRDKLMKLIARKEANIQA